jgi:ribonuclease P protein component
MGEAHLSTEQPETVQEAWVPSADVHAGGPSHSQGSSGQGSGQAVGLIWSVRDRAAFSRLTTDGRRFRCSSPVSVRFSPSSEGSSASMPPCVAFSVNRTVGDAVSRNRLRRRLRDLFRREAAAGLPSGAYLVVARPGAPELPFPALGAAVHDLCQQIRSANRSANPVQP